MRRLERILLIIATFGAGAALPCSLDKSHSWYWTDETLVARSPRVVLARAVSVKVVRAGAPSRYSPLLQTRFEVLETLKGPKSREVTVAASPPVRDTGQQTRRAELHKDCQLAVSFVPGRTYLLFPGQIHPRAYDESSTSSQWYTAVRTLLGR